MPLALRDLQAAFAAHLMAGDRADLIAAVLGDSIKSEARLDIHRHHVLHGLAGALASSFPTVQSLVGEEFFRTLARAFVANTPPRQPVLAEYGAGFADFIERYSPAGGLPYLADIARFDWAMSVAFHSPAEPHLEAADLALVPVEQLLAMTVGLASGAALVRSRWPIDRIWRTAQANAPAEKIELTATATCLLVVRRADDAGFVALAAGEQAFLGALADRASLERAAQAAFAVDPAFDLSTVFGRLLVLGAFAALQQGAL